MIFDYKFSSLTALTHQYVTGDAPLRNETLAALTSSSSSSSSGSSPVRNSPETGNWAMKFPPVSQPLYLGYCH